jgi:hypothetical protein
LFSHLIGRPVLAAALAAFIAVPVAQAQESAAQQIPGTNLSLAVPDGFEPQSLIEGNPVNGFVNPETGAAIVAVEFDNSNYDQLAEAFGSIDGVNALFAEQKITADSVETVDTDVGAIPYMHGQQAFDDGSHTEKWIALLKGDNTMVVEVTTAEDGELTTADIEALLKSATFSKGESLTDQIAALPFSVEVADPWVSYGVNEGNSLFLLAPSASGGGDATPTLLLTGVPNVEGMPGLQEAAESILQNAFDSVNIEKSEAAQFLGGDGWVISGTAEDSQDGHVQFMQWFATPGSGYMHVLAYAVPDAFAQLQPSIETVAGSVSWK